MSSDNEGGGEQLNAPRNPRWGRGSRSCGQGTVDTMAPRSRDSMPRRASTRCCMMKARGRAWIYRNRKSAPAETLGARLMERGKLGPTQKWG